eukprot:scaffold292_cov161-Ochromonas_danica.AAC.1
MPKPRLSIILRRSAQEKDNDPKAILAVIRASFVYQASLSFISGSLMVDSSSNNTDNKGID